MDMDLEIKRFKMELLRKMPFYGDIVMRLPFVENRHISTAQTNGRKIEYNPEFLACQDRGQRNFILMHEVFHVLLLHCKRGKGRNPKIWNTAADIIVNDMLLSLTNGMNKASIPFKRPESGIFANICVGETAENLYEKMLVYNKDESKNSKIVFIKPYELWDQISIVEKMAPGDIVISDSNIEETDIELSEEALMDIIRESALKNRSNMGSYYVPNQIIGFVNSKHIKWQTLLRDFLVEEQNDETSYSTPERKYIHMDLIIPGYGRNDEKIEEVWAFVDSSGSISGNELAQFLTQIYRIAKEFKCVFNICYWDTDVTDIYKKIASEKSIIKCQPKHSGGTDINCVYRWLKDNKVKPDVMLILTDGYFGIVDSTLVAPSLRKKTILVLSGSIATSENLKSVGKIARLE